MSVKPNSKISSFRPSNLCSWTSGLPGAVPAVRWRRCWMRLPSTIGSNAILLKFNVDLDPNVAVRYKVRGIPTLILFKDGKEAGRLVGAHEKEQITALIDSASQVSRT